MQLNGLWNGGFSTRGGCCPARRGEMWKSSTEPAGSRRSPSEAVPAAPLGGFAWPTSQLDGTKTPWIRLKNGEPVWESVARRGFTARCSGSLAQHYVLAGFMPPCLCLLKKPQTVFPLQQHRLSVIFAGRHTEQHPHELRVGLCWEQPSSAF